MADDSRFFTRLQEEINLWEQEGVLPPEAVETLRRRYSLGTAPPPGEAGQWIRWVMYLAVFAFLAAFFSFAGSSSELAGAATRVGILLVSSLAALGAGVFLHRRQRNEGMALLILGGLLLPIAFYFAVHQYKLLVLDAPYLWWSLLGMVMAALYTAMARKLEEEGLGGVALLSTSAAAFLLATHLDLLRSFYAVLAAALALGCLFIERTVKHSWRPAFVRAAALIGQVLAVAALLLPIMLQRYGTPGAVLGYLLAAGYFLLRVRLLDSLFSLAPLTLALVAAVGAFVRAAGVQNDLLPLIQLVFSAALIGVGVGLLQKQDKALDLLLSTVLVIILPGTAGLLYLRPEMFRGSWLYFITIALYCVLGLSLYAAAYRVLRVRGILAYLATWHLFAALILLLASDRGATVEAYTLPLGALLLFDLLLEPVSARQGLLIAATTIMAAPSLYLSVSDGGPLRTVLLSLGGITLIAVGAFRSYGPALLLGIFVLLPAIFIKVLPGLAELGIPRFVWFALFGGLLLAIALILQRRSRRP